MVKITVLYPNNEGSRFDWAYYLDKHVPLVRQKLGAALRSVAIDQGLGGVAPGSRAPYVAIFHMTFDSMDAFQAAFASHSEAIMGDIPNFTGVQPTIQISEVKV